MQLWVARLFGTAASQMLLVAIGWHMYELTSSAWDLGLVGLYQFVPALLLALLAGHVVDRRHRGRIVAACFAVQGVVALVLLLAVAQRFDVADDLRPRPRAVRRLDRARQHHLVRVAEPAREPPCVGRHGLARGVPGEHSDAAVGLLRKGGRSEAPAGTDQCGGARSQQDDDQHRRGEPAKRTREQQQEGEHHDDEEAAENQAADGDELGEGIGLLEVEELRPHHDRRRDREQDGEEDPQ